MKVSQGHRSAKSLLGSEEENYGPIVLARRTFGEPGYRKSGPFHLVNRRFYDNLVSYPEYQAGAMVKAWCGANFRLGPSEVLGGRAGSGSPLNADICERCFMLKRRR